ncbi:MAG TPA: hypothetical protein VI461_17125 [Chitinophagaceae bacterium]|nr:hypothetical protein [Chitinophagaceae bacterium]
MRFILILSIACVLLSCEKDKFTTKPQIKYKDVNTTTISGSQELRIRLDLTDKEGDFTTYLGVKKTVNGCPGSEFSDTTFFSIPAEFLNSKEKEGEVVITLNENNRLRNACSVPGGGTRPDTTVFSFWTKDQAGNYSDTSYSATIIFLD